MLNLEEELFIKSDFKKCYLPQSRNTSKKMVEKGYVMDSELFDRLVFKNIETLNSFKEEYFNSKNKSLILGKYLGYPKESCVLFSYEINNNILFNDRICVRINGLNYISYIRTIQSDLIYLTKLNHITENTIFKLEKNNKSYRILIKKFDIENNFNQLVQQIKETIF